MDNTIAVNNDQNIWSSECQVFDFFSVFLERHVLSLDRFDLSFTPVEYFDQIFSCAYSEEGQGYLVLLMMLFTEYYQELRTGSHKIMLPEEKYQLMSEQFLIFCECELLRREGVIKHLTEENLFDPNFRTIFTVDNREALNRFQDLFYHANIEVVEKEEAA